MYRIILRRSDGSFKHETFVFSKELEAAKRMGVDNTEYIKQKLKLETNTKESQVKEMQFILKERIKKLKRDYQKKGKLEYLIRIKEDRSLLQYIRKNYGNIQQGG